MRPLYGCLACGFVAAIACVTPRALDASVGRLVPARTGGFGEMTCQQCHRGNPLNDPAGTLALGGWPETYTPGEQYVITLTLERPGLARAGFQASAREDGINMSAGSNAGSLHPRDELSVSSVGESKGIRYLQHSERGTEVRTPGTATWTFAWTAPDAEGVPVALHVAANAANDDSSPLGDFIYTAVVRSR